jgi:hypothetical protein
MLLSARGDADTMHVDDERKHGARERGSYLPYPGERK